jgi:hypothetical protein
MKNGGKVLKIIRRFGDGETFRSVPRPGQETLAEREFACLLVVNGTAFIYIEKTCIHYILTVCIALNFTKELYGSIL